MSQVGWPKERATYDFVMLKEKQHTILFFKCYHHIVFKIIMHKNFFQPIFFISKQYRESVKYAQIHS